jgi:hypothetical protein
MTPYSRLRKTEIEIPSGVKVIPYLAFVLGESDL